MKKQQKKKDKGLAVRREVVRFLGSTTRVAGGAICAATGNCGPCTGTCECSVGCTQTGCTNSYVISY